MSHMLNKNRNRGLLPSKLKHTNSSLSVVLAINSKMNKKNLSTEVASNNVCVFFHFLPFSVTSGLVTKYMFLPHLDEINLNS